MEELIKLFRLQLGKKNYQALESTWLELLELDPPLEELLKLIQLCQRWAPVEVTVTLLWVLADALGDRHRPKERLQVLRLLVSITPDDPRLTRDVSECLHKLYPEEPLLERLLQKSGLGYGEPVTPALTRFDRYIKLLPGKLVYHPGNGPGKIIELDLLFERVKVRFHNGAELNFDIPLASRSFSFPEPDGFFALEENDPTQLTSLAENQPQRLVILLLRDTRLPMTPTEIKGFIEPLIGAERYPAFWEKARRALARHPNVLTRTRPNATYQWTEQAKTDAAGESGKGQSQNPVAPTPADAISPGALDREAIAEFYSGLRTARERKWFLESLVQARPEDWDALYLEIFSTAADRSTRATIWEKLKDEKPHIFQTLLESTITAYRTSPEPFLFLAETLVQESDAPATFPAAPRAVLTRLLDILETEKSRTFCNRAKKVLTFENYRLIRRTLQEITETEAGKLLERIRRLKPLEPYVQDEIAAAFGERFPELNTPAPEEVIWSTARGIEKARAELSALIEEELPRTAAEIARARSFGDLSENYEYKAAKEKQARLMQRINRLRADLSRAKPIQPERVDTSRVTVGCRVKLQDEQGVIYEYSILGPWDADPDNGIISYESPLASTLIGKKTKERVFVNNRSLTVVEIKPAL